ncbi:MAG: hypothetical protein L0170_02940, partial [Acidobacteria bacterium]|nr:hypothetical protein [Acidobacteriota bacterium]
MSIRTSRIAWIAFATGWVALATLWAGAQGRELHRVALRQRPRPRRPAGTWHGAGGACGWRPLARFRRPARC